MSEVPNRADTNLCTVRGTVPTIRGTVPTVRGTVATVRGTVPTVHGTVPTVRGTVPTVRGTVPTVRGTVPTVCGTVPTVRGTELTVSGYRHRNVGRDSSVGIAAGRSGDRILVGARFSAPVQTGPGAHPASYTMDTGLFPGGKVRPGGGVEQPPIYSRG
jgi:hypothetical protein